MGFLAINFIVSGLIWTPLEEILDLFIFKKIVNGLQVMKASKGKANPALLNKILLEKLNDKS